MFLEGKTKPHKSNSIIIFYQKLLLKVQDLG